METMAKAFLTPDATAPAMPIQIPAPVNRGVVSPRLWREVCDALNRCEGGTAAKANPTRPAGPSGDAMKAEIHGGMNSPGPFESGLSAVDAQQRYSCRPFADEGWPTSLSSSSRLCTPSFR